MVIDFHLSINNNSSALSSLTENNYGLPRFNHCAFAYNNSLYVFGGVIPTTYNDTISASIAIVFPASDRIMTDAPAFFDLPLDAAFGSHGASCSVTSSGQAIFLAPEKPATVFDLQTERWVSMPSLVGSSETALRSFNETQPSEPRREMVSAMYKDLWIIYGGFVANRTINATADSSHWTASTSTFVLDTRTPSRWVWYDIASILVPPSFVSGATMISTQRWVLHISASALITPTTSAEISHCVVAVYCFDPILLSWLGQVASFNSTTDLIKAAPLDFAGDTESVLFFPAIRNTNDITSSLNRRQEQQQYGFWRLDISLFDAQATVQYIHLPPSEKNNSAFQPVAGGSVTRVTDDLVVLYGGQPFGHASFQFWNITTATFVYPDWWSSFVPSSQTPNAAPSSSHGVSQRSLAIILGTVLGFFGILALVAFYLCYFRKRRNQDQQQRPGPSLPPILSLPTINAPDAPVARRENQLNETSVATTSSCVVTPPQQPLHNTNATHVPSADAPSENTIPLNGSGSPCFPSSSAKHRESLSSTDVERQRQIRKASRFAEHFDTGPSLHAPDHEGPSAPR
ncbi:hypothetical protein BX666DRAFT_1989017 [Dichotomocladium elegans]|nr:hypothetical protein BX666DRAFT_1989017 [Dichotomocladium elegans]